MDSKSIGLCPQGLKSPRCRNVLMQELRNGSLWSTAPSLVAPSTLCMFFPLCLSCSLLALLRFPHWSACEVAAATLGQSLAPLAEACVGMGCIAEAIAKDGAGDIAPAELAAGLEDATRANSGISHGLHPIVA